MPGEPIKWSVQAGEPIGEGTLVRLTRVGGSLEARLVRGTEGIPDLRLWRALASAQTGQIVQVERVSRDNSEPPAKA